MSEVHGRLLIGGMTLKDLYGVVELKNDCGCAEWCGHLLVEPHFNECLEPGRPYRLELDDGRSGQIALTSVECPPGVCKLRVAFDGLSPLSSPRPAPVVESARTEPLEVFG
ncbi:MAG: hypothetical protein ACT4QC_05035 [Planctomycetaceae bacterium]